MNTNFSLQSSGRGNLQFWNISIKSCQIRFRIVLSFPPPCLGAAGWSDKAKVWWCQRGCVQNIVSTQNIVSVRHSMLVMSRLYTFYFNICCDIILLGLKWGSQLSAFNYFEGQLSLINRTLPLRESRITISPFRLWTS